jgi:hypothetical protein
VQVELDHRRQPVAGKPVSSWSLSQPGPRAVDVVGWHEPHLIYRRF